MAHNVDAASHGCHTDLLRPLQHAALGRIRAHGATFDLRLGHPVLSPGRRTHAEYGMQPIALEDPECLSACRTRSAYSPH
jgi:hypothetical protein